MILSEAEDIIFNGHTVEGVVFNGNLIWPKEGQSVVYLYNQTNAPIGVSASTGGELVYTREFSTGSFQFNVPSGINLLIGAITPSYRKIDIQSDDLSISQGSRYRGDSATSYYRATASAGTAVISVPSIVNNEFYASGTFPAFTASSNVTSQGSSCASLTYLSGDTGISGSITRPYLTNTGSGSMSVMVLKPDMRLSSISAYLNVGAGWSVGSTSDTRSYGTALWRLGNIVHSARPQIERSQSYSTTTSLTTSLFVLTSNTGYANSDFGCSVDASYRAHGVTATMGSDKTWAMTGLAP